MSSRKSSSRKSSSSDISFSTNASTSIDNKSSPMSAILTSVIVIIYNLLILGYLITLEGQRCNCIRDWRHDFLKYYSGMMIIYSIILILLSGTKFQNSIVVKGMQHILMLASFVNIWCLYTYVGDLDKTYCTCAIEKQKNMHYFLYIWRYILVGMIILGLILIIIGALYN
jgi:hypothetical protein